MIKTVAVGTNGSDTAGTAVQAAPEPAERYPASFVVLSAFNGGSGAAAAPCLSPSAHPEWASNAAEQVERISPSRRSRRPSAGSSAALRWPVSSRGSVPRRQQR